MKQLTNGTCLAIYDETLDCFLDENGHQYSYPNDNIIYSDGKKIDSIQLRNAISDLRKLNYSDHNIYAVRVEFLCKFDKANKHEKFYPIEKYENFLKELEVCYTDVTQSCIEEDLRCAKIDLKSEMTKC